MAAGRQAGHHPGVSRSACLVRQAGSWLHAPLPGRGAPLHRAPPAGGHPGGSPAACPAAHGCWRVRHGAARSVCRRAQGRGHRPDVQVVMATPGVAAHDTKATLALPQACPLLLEQTVCLPPAQPASSDLSHTCVASSAQARQRPQRPAGSTSRRGFSRCGCEGQAIGSCRGSRQEMPAWSRCTVQGQPPPCHPVPTMHHTMAHLLLHGHHQRVLLLHEVGGKPGQGGILQQHRAPGQCAASATSLLPRCKTAAPAYPAQQLAPPPAANHPCPCPSCTATAPAFGPINRPTAHLLLPSILQVAQPLQAPQQHHHVCHQRLAGGGLRLLQRQLLRQILQGDHTPGTW